MGWQDCVLDPIGCTVGNVAGEAAASTWESFTRWVARGLSDLAATVFAAFGESTTPDFTVGWFNGYLDTIVVLSLPVLALFFVLQVIAGVVRREVGYLGRALLGVALGAAGVPVALALVTGLSSFVDAASAYLIRTHSPDGFQRLFETGAVLAAGGGGGFVLVAMFLAIFAMVALYLVLLLRKVALLAIVVFAPLALVGWTWQSTRSWLRRWVEVTAALLLSKFAMAVVFSLGLSAIGGAGSGQGPAATIGDLLAGVVLFGIAAFAPWACFHFLHWAGTESATALHQATHRGASSVRHETTRAQHALQRATSTQDFGDHTPRSGRASSLSNGLRRADANGTSNSGAGSASSAGSAGKGSGAAAGSSPTRGGSTAASGGAGGAAAGGVAGGVVAGVKATHGVAQGIKATGQQAGAAVEQHTDGARGPSTPPTEQSPGSDSVERATRPDSSIRREPGR